MRIDHIKVYAVRIPFTYSIDYNLKKNKHSESIVISVHTEDGKVGYGEGNLRCYVTGESIHEIINTFIAAYNQNPVSEINNLEDIKNWSMILYEIHRIPSLVAALEIALLDLLGQYQSCSISNFIGSDTSLPFAYSAIISFLSIPVLEETLEFVKLHEFSCVKIKVGHKNDLEHLDLARQILGDQIDMRVDANRAWTLHEGTKKIKLFEQFNLSCVEEPLLESHVSKLPELSKQVDTPIMLDESVFSLGQAAYFAGRISADKLLFNLKISKSGGMLQTSAIHQFAKSNGIDCLLGCNVGEAAILSAAGRLFAQTHDVKYLEGSYSPFFMEDDISTEPVSFSKKGLAEPLVGDGLGIQIDPEKLEKYGECVAILSETEGQVQESVS